MHLLIAAILSFIAGAVLSFFYSSRYVKKAEASAAKWELYFVNLKEHLQSSLAAELLRLENKAKAEEGAVKEFTVSEIEAIKKKISSLVDRLL